MTKRCRACTFLFATLLLLVSCAPEPQQAVLPGEKPGTRAVFRRMYDVEISTLNYLYTNNARDLETYANLVDCLVEYDPYGKIIPSLAESWSSNEESTVWTFSIRPGVKWVDYQGNEVAEVTAQDWVDAARWVNTAANESGIQYVYDAVVKNADDYYAYTSYLLKSENGTKTVDAKGTPIEVVPPLEFSEVGVRAEDRYTLVYTLEQPTLYFPSLLNYGGYMPVYGPFMEEQGDRFGVDHTALLYNGGFILSEFEPQYRRVLTKNPTYWDLDNIHIDQMEWKYNASAATLAPEAFRRGEFDFAQLDTTLLPVWQANEEKKGLLSPSRPNLGFSYFYAFNFEPRFDERLEPDNWIKAVNNENFRLSIMHAIDIENVLLLLEPENPDRIRTKTITPPTFSVGDGLDYTQYPALKPISESESFQPARALDYKDKAKAELIAAGATFPIKIYMRYNPTVPSWDKECQLLQQQLESTLGSDYIKVVVEAGSATNYLATVRRRGDFGLMKCNWGADYADPQTWIGPFEKNNTFSFIDQSDDREIDGKPCNNKTAQTQALVEEYYRLLELARTITTDINARYTAFAEAEAFLLEHGFAVPSNVHTDGYVATRLHSLEAPYAPYGVAMHRVKFQYVYDQPISAEEMESQYVLWKEELLARQGS